MTTGTLNRSKIKSVSEPTNFGYERIDYDTESSYRVYNGIQYLGIAQRVSKTRFMQWFGCSITGIEHFARTRKKVAKLLLKEFGKPTDGIIKMRGGVV